LTKRTKEADTVKISKFPDAVGFKAWKQETRSEITSASGKGDKTLAWLMKLDEAGTTFESLRTVASSSLWISRFALL
jgi:hypothetical protein